MRNTTKIIRNDDVSLDTEMDDIKWFCELCDKYGFKAMQCITPIGKTHDISYKMSNKEIPKEGNIFENTELIEYLKGRNDIIAVHGLYHTHKPTKEEIEMSKRLLENAGLKPTYFVPPFNEGDYGDEVCGLKVSAKTKGLEECHEELEPINEISYLHSWRFGKIYKKEDLEQCIKKITML